MQVMSLGMSVLAVAMQVDMAMAVAGDLRLMALAGDVVMDMAMAVAGGVIGLAPVFMVIRLQLITHLQ